ncbi:hypothetical protein [Methanogenium organophilum]|uniref:Uncharacterized protein n=1 Tax=Methanogenium organophilum TaxID=2199 RepID=A0A9X9S380_METOG|nr:hypothetical protein [Methanogenium organophilum]WAI01079.1 hypothetical protein OU421_11755 [Methanogenium organophilum]
MLSQDHQRIRNTATVIIVVLFILTTLFTAGCLNKRQYGTGDIITGIWILKVDADGNKQWTTIIDGDPKITGAAIIQTSDGGYAVAGTEGLIPRIFTFDAGGEAVSDIAIDTTLEWGESLVEAPGGGYVVAGHSGVLTRMDVRGNTLWNTSIDDESERGERLVLVRAPNGGYAVVGNNQSVRLDENGMTLWETAFAPDKSARTIITAPAGGFVTGGTCDAGAWVAQLNAEGDRVWNRTFSNELLTRLYIVRLSPAGTYDLIYATEQVITRGPEYSFFTETTEVSLSAKGELIAERPVQASPFIVATEDGGYAYAGYSNPKYNQLHESGHRGTPLQVVKLDNDGAVTWDKSFNIGNDRYVTSIIQTADGGFAIFGNSIYF